MRARASARLWRMDRRSGVIAPDTRAPRALPRKVRRCPASRNVPAAKWAIKATSMRLAIGGAHTATVSAWREGTLIAPAKRAEHIGMARGHPHRPGETCRTYRHGARAPSSLRRNAPNTWHGADGGQSAGLRLRASRVRVPARDPSRRAGRGEETPASGPAGMGRLGSQRSRALPMSNAAWRGGRAIVARGRNDCPRRPATQPESGCSSSRRASLPSSSSHSRPSGACTTARMRSPMS